MRSGACGARDFRYPIVRRREFRERRRSYGLLWSVSEIVTNNRAQTGAREFLAVMSADGPLAGYRLTTGGDLEPGVYWWFPIDAEYRKAADSLELFLDGWIRGQITA